MRPRLLVSTTSHKHEPLLTALEVFARLDLRDLDLNLHHVMELDLDVEAIRRKVETSGLRVWALSGGWCDFFHGPPRIEDTFRSIDRQVTVAGQFGVDLLRLFFGRLLRADYSADNLNAVCGNLRRLSDRYPDMQLVFENHDGVSLDPEICGDILARVNRPNVRMNFDPINFERHGVNSLQALGVVRPFVGHVHLKGLQGSEFCEFGVGDVDLTPVLRTLLTTGYTGSFSVEYEGPFDKTLRLYQSVERARKVLATLTAQDS